MTDKSKREKTQTANTKNDAEAVTDPGGIKRTEWSTMINSTQLNLTAQVKSTKSLKTLRLMLAVDLLK